MNTIHTLLFLGFFSNLFNALEASYKCVPASELKESKYEECAMRPIFVFSDQTPRMIECFAQKNFIKILSYPLKREVLIKFIEYIRPEFFQNRFWSKQMARVLCEWREFLIFLMKKPVGTREDLLIIFLEKLINLLDIQFLKSQFLLAQKSNNVFYWVDCYGHQYASFEISKCLGKQTSEDEKLLSVQRLWLRKNIPQDVTLSSLQCLIWLFKTEFGYCDTRDITKECKNFSDFYTKTKKSLENSVDDVNAIVDFVLDIHDQDEILINNFDAMKLNSNFERSIL